MVYLSGPIAYRVSESDATYEAHHTQLLQAAHVLCQPGGMDKWQGFSIALLKCTVASNNVASRSWWDPILADSTQTADESLNVADAGFVLQDLGIVKPNPGTRKATEVSVHIDLIRDKEQPVKQLQFYASATRLKSRPSQTRYACRKST